MQGRASVPAPARSFPGINWLGSPVFTALSLLCLFGFHIGATVTLHCWHPSDGATTCAVTRSLLGATIFHETIDRVREVEHKISFARSGGRSNVRFCRLLLVSDTATLGLTRVASGCDSEVYALAAPLRHFLNNDRPDPLFSIVRDWVPLIISLLFLAIGIFLGPGAHFLWARGMVTINEPQ